MAPVSPPMKRKTPTAGLQASTEVSYQVNALDNRNPCVEVLDLISRFRRGLFFLTDAPIIEP